MSSRIWSRALLFPGPLPATSHLGLTLLRHVVATGLRYSLYQLGLPLPETTPVRIVRLRLYLDGDELRRSLAGRPGGEAVASALVAPGGAGRRPGAAMGAAVRLHRLRLGLGLRRPPPRSVRPPGVGAGAPRLWAGFHVSLRRRLPALNDALLGELIAAIGRRHRRAVGRRVTPCASREAARLLAGRRPRLGRLGPPDPRMASWRDDPLAAERAVTAAGARWAGTPTHPLRGRFREAWRETLDELRLHLLPLAEAAARRGWLEHADDAFLLPFEAAGDLAAAHRPEWMRAAAAANRRELAAQRDLEPPPETLDGSEGRVRIAAGTGPDLSPLWPLE